MCIISHIISIYNIMILCDIYIYTICLYMVLSQEAGLHLTVPLKLVALFLADPVQRELQLPARPAHGGHGCQRVGQDLGAHGHPRAAGRWLQDLRPGAVQRHGGEHGAHAALGECRAPGGRLPSCAVSQRDVARIKPQRRGEVLVLHGLPCVSTEKLRLNEAGLCRGAPLHAHLVSPRQAAARF